MMIANMKVRVLMKKGQVKTPHLHPRRQSMVQHLMQRSSELLTPLNLYAHDVKKMKRMKRMKMKWMKGMRNTIKMRTAMKIWRPRIRISQCLIAMRIRDKMKGMICRTMGFVSLPYDNRLLTFYFLR